MTATGMTGRGVAAATMAVLAFMLSAQPAAARAQEGWLGLAAGHVGDYDWTVSAKRRSGSTGAGQQGARRPCLLVGTTWQTGPYSYLRNKNRQCAGSDGLTAND